MSKCKAVDLAQFPFRDWLVPVTCVHVGYEFEQFAATLRPKLRPLCVNAAGIVNVDKLASI